MDNGRITLSGGVWLSRRSPGAASSLVAGISRTTVLVLPRLSLKQWCHASWRADTDKISSTLT